MKFDAFSASIDTVYAGALMCVGVGACVCACVCACVLVCVCLRAYIYNN